jgi:ABC-type ATPase with predicted acetyltransferase domain
VVHPKFRSIGLGAEIVKKTLSLASTEIVETMAVMARYNKFFESAGMIPVELEEDRKFLNAVKNLEVHTKLRRELLASKSLNLKIVSRMNPKQLELAIKFALGFCVASKFRRTELVPKVEARNKQALAEALSLVRGNPLYLYWRNHSF